MSDGIDIRVEIDDYGEMDEDGNPVSYQENIRLSEYEVARSSNDDLVEILMRQAGVDVVHAWRSQFGDDNE